MFGEPRQPAADRSRFSLSLLPTLFFGDRLVYLVYELQLALAGDVGADAAAFFDRKPQGLFQPQLRQLRRAHPDEPGRQFFQLEGIPPALALADLLMSFGKIFLAFFHILDQDSKLQGDI